MDVVERLSLESASKASAQSCEHIHRYEFAAELCHDLRVLDVACGSGYGSGILARHAASVHGIDKDVASIDLAAATIGQRTGATFEACDAVAYLDRELRETYDAIVCFEGLEHLHDLDRVIARLRSHLDEGVTLVASVPNSKAFAEENPFHLTDFGYEEAVDLLERLSGGVMLYQYLTEGSVIYATRESELPPSTVKYLDDDEPEYANHFILVVNVDPQRVDLAQSGSSMFVEAPIHNRYVRGLEVSNRELRRRNSELARKIIGVWPVGLAKTGSAAPSFIMSLETRVTDLEEMLADSMQEEARLEDQIAKRDDLIIAQRREVLQLRQRIVGQTGGANPGRIDARSTNA
jgi:SAM-dependent methyltransferase